MYCEFYQLRERPFNVTADPKFLYLNARYREALASLQYGLSQRKGFVTLIGEAGTGKTTLLKKLLDDLDPNTRTVFIFNTNVTFDEILEYIFAEFDLPVHNGKRLYMLQRLNAFLLEELQQGRNVALLIDEAQDLDQSALEDLRLLSNLETAKEKILQIVLSGQPELGQKLGSPALRQLRQRVAINCRLLPLTREEISEYIQSRLVAAGGADPKLFTRDAEDRIYEISMGIPRLVNVVCDNALVIGYALGKKRITAEVVTEAAADLLTMEPAVDAGEAVEGVPVVAAAPLQRGRRWSQLGVVAVVLVAIVVGLLSVGRSLLRREADFMTDPAVARPQFEVINPGTRVNAAPAPAPRVPAEPESDNRAGSEPLGARPAAEDQGSAAMVDDAMQPPAPGVPGAPAGLGDAGRPEAADPWELAAADPAGISNPPGAPMDPAEPVARVPEGRPEAQPGLRPEVQPGLNTDVPKPMAGSQLALGAPTDVPFPSRPTADHDQSALTHPPTAGDGARGVPAPAAALPEPKAEVQPAKQEGQAEPGDDGISLALQTYQPVKVLPGQSISELAVKQYGQASYTILDLVKLANPRLRDVDVVSVGQTLQLPQLDEGHVVLRQEDGRYGLLLLSSPAWQKVKALEAGLRQRGISARVQTTDFGPGRTVYRLLVGGMASRESAVAAGKKVGQLLREDEQIAALARQ